MRRPLDRLLVALIPYTGLLTVSTCGGPADCEERGDHRTVQMTATVTGTIDLETTIDGPISAGLVRRESTTADATWQCEARVSARRDRAKDDTSPAPLPATAQIFCSIGDGQVTTRSWSFTLPLDDLRAPALAPATTATMEVTRQVHENASGSCNTTMPARLTTSIVASTGASAAPPSYVTPDFARRITTTVDVDQTSGACGAISGALSLEIAIDAKSFVETDTPTCL